jgi:hypothetical protein
MAAPIPKHLSGLRPQSGERGSLSLAANKRLTESLQLLIDTNHWIVEEEVSFYFGIPPWLNTAVPCVLMEIARRADQCPVESHNAAAWIRKQARRAARRLEDKTIARRIGIEVHDPNGILWSLESEISSRLESNAAPRRNDLRTSTHGRKWSDDVDGREV